MRLATPLLVAFLLLARQQDIVEGKPWRLSSPLAVPRMKLVVAKDIVNARSLASLSTSLSSAGISSSPRLTQSTVDETVGNNSEDDAVSAEVTANSIAPQLSDDVARGGHSTVTMKQADKIDVNDTRTVPSPHMTDPFSPEIRPVIPPVKGLSKKLSRRKKNKLDSNAVNYAKKLKNRNSINIRRKVLHACFGLGFGAMNYFIPRNRFVPGMTILTTATLIMELLRYRRGFGWMNDALHNILGSSLRKHEMEGKFTGSFYFFLGVTVTAALYPKTCATLGICQLALADPSASYFGRQTRHVYWSRIENGLGGFGRNKGFLGFLGGALFCFPFNYRVLSIAKFGAEGMPGGKQALVFASLALGLAGAFADLAVPTPALTLPKKICGIPVPPLHVDDNFVVPVVSGYACAKVFKYLGWATDLELGRFILI